MFSENQRQNIVLKKPVIRIVLKFTQSCFNEETYPASFFSCIIAEEIIRSISIFR